MTQAITLIGEQCTLLAHLNETLERQPTSQTATIYRRRNFKLTFRFSPSETS
jgi:hypothetical protein